MNIHEKLHQQFVIPVIRNQNEEDLYSLCRALIDGGLSALEITLMSESAFKVISKLSQDTSLLIGAGTVTNEVSCQKAMDAGAKFLVSPGLNENIILLARKNSIPFIPGVLTPTEVMRAMNLELDLLKIFPISSVGGTDYLKNLSGPFPALKFMATGGIELNMISDYKKANAHCIGLGSNLTPKELLSKKDWKGISSFIQKTMEKKF